MTTEAGKRHRHYWRLDDGCACGEWMPGTDEWAQASRDRAIEAEAVAAERARIAERVRQVDWLYVDYWKIEAAILAIIEEKP